MDLKSVRIEQYLDYWPFLIPLVTLVILIYFGRSLYAAIRFVDSRISNNLLGRLAGLVCDKPDEKPLRKVFRWFCILICFSIFGTAIYLALYPMDDRKLSAYLELAAVTFTYLMALSVAKQWINNESAILEEETPSKKTVMNASRLKHEGFIAILILVICVPFSLHALNVCFQWHNDVQDIKDWFWLSLSLLYKSASEIFDAISFKEAPDITPGVALSVAMLTHVLVLTYIVVEGVGIIVKADFELFKALKAFFERRDFDRVLPFGKRVQSELIRMMKGEMPKRLKREEFGEDGFRDEVRKQAALKLAEIAYLDPSTTEKSIEELKAVVLDDEKKNPANLRVAAVKGLTVLCKKLSSEQQQKDVKNFVRDLMFRKLKMKYGNFSVLQQVALSIGELHAITEPADLKSLSKIGAETQNLQLANNIATCLIYYWEPQDNAMVRSNLHLAVQIITQIVAIADMLLL